MANMSEQINVSASPHVRSKMSTSRIMFCVIISLLPASVYGIYQFGFNAALLIATCVAACVATEFLYELIIKKPKTIGDLSAVLTGLLLALNLPPDATWWMAIIGSVFAILVVKMLFGGLGQNFMNPALAGRCFLVICFAARMTSFSYDGVTSATPLAIIRDGGSVNLMDMFMGKIPGTIGEVSTVLLLAGAIFLIVTGIIDLRIPCAYLVTFVLFIGVFAGHGWDLSYIAAQLCGGGLMLGAFFMATDYVTSPVNPRAQIVYGVGCGLLTVFIRWFGAYAEGVSYAILIMNATVWLLDKALPRKRFGAVKEKKAKEAAK